MRVIVRKAVPTDAPALVEMLEVRYETEYKGWAAKRGEAKLRTWDHDKMQEGVETVLRKGIAYVAETDRIIGSIGGDGVYGGWFTTDVIFAEFWFFVEPEFRKSRIASTLLKTLKAKVNERGFPYRSAVISGADPDRLEQFYLRLGFRKLGAIVEG